MQPNEHNPSPDVALLFESLQAAFSTATSVTAQLLPRVQALYARLDALESEIGRLREQAPANQRPSQRPVRPLSLVREEALPPPAPAPPARAVSSYVLLEVESAGEPLDLRAIDRPLTAHPQVADVALMDYDGRRARLKVWTRAGADARAVGASLHQTIHESLGSGRNGVRVEVLSSAA